MRSSKALAEFIEYKTGGRGNLDHLTNSCGCDAPEIISGNTTSFNRLGPPVQEVKPVPRIKTIPKIKKIVDTIPFGDRTEALGTDEVIFRSPGFVPEIPEKPKKLVTVTVKTDTGNKEEVKTGVLVKTPEVLKTMGKKDIADKLPGDGLNPLWIMGLIGVGLFALGRKSKTRTITV